MVNQPDEPLWEVTSPQPTHIKWGDGTLEFVRPADGGYTSPENLTEIPEGFDRTWMIPDYQTQTFTEDIDGCKAMKWEKAKLRRDELRYGGCDTPKGRMDSDLESQHKINGAVSMANLLGAAFTVNWTMQDNSVVAHDKAEIEAAGLALGMWDATCHAAGQAVRDAINAATTLAELFAMDVEAMMDAAVAP